MNTKIALITGATSGIGKASAITLAKMGYDIIATGRRKDRLDELETELPAGVRYYPLVFDVRDREKVRDILGNLPADWAAVDVLINNAGFGINKAFSASDITAEQQMFDVLVRTPMRTPAVGLPRPSISAFTRSARSSMPTTSAPAALASSALAP